MAMYKGKIPIIVRSLDEGFIRGTPDIKPSTGCVPRDFSIDPVAMGDSPAGMKVYEESDWDALYDESESKEDSLEHMYLRGGVPAFEFLDQNGFPDCWYHSTAHAMMSDRMKQNLPPIRLNAVAGATLLGRTNGGWCGLSMKHAREKGVPEVGTGPGQWPYQSRRGADDAALRENMAKHKSLEDWYDLGRSEYDQELTKKQLATCGFENWPAPSDYDRFGHSMLTLRWVRIGRGEWGPLTLNSWQGFGYHGLCVLANMVPDNSCAMRSSTPS